MLIIVKNVNQIVNHFGLSIVPFVLTNIISYTTYFINYKTFQTLSSTVKKWCIELGYNYKYKYTETNC